MIQIGKNKWVKFTLAAGMLLSTLSACSGSEGNPANTGTSSSSETGGTSSEPVELSIFVNHPWFPVRDWSGSVPELITEKTGVKLKVTIAADDKQLPLMIASGDLPDLVFTATNLDRLADPKISYSWTDLIEQYAPDFNVDAERIAINTASDGKFYTVRNNFATEEEWNAYPNAIINSSALGIRKDMMEELGNPALNNFEDLEKLLGTVKATYPDVIPLMLDINWGFRYFKMQNGVPSAYTDLFEQDGKVQHYLRHPGMLEVYKYMNRLYRNGYMTAENFAFKDTIKDNDYALKGKVFALVDNTNDFDNLNSQITNQGTGYNYSQLTKPLGNDPKEYFASIGWSGVYITKNNKNPEASIKFMQYMFSEEGQKLGFWGIEGQHWKWNEEGQYPELLYKQGDADFINKEAIGLWGLMSNSAALEQVAPGTESSEVKKMAKEHAEFVPALGMLVPNSDTEIGVIRTKLDEMIKNEEIKIYMADSEENAVKFYQELMDKAEKIGLSKYEAWANEKYNTVKDTFK
ncbi:extracellular solute-binding protein [Paenibacillus sp. CAU 1782]